MFSFFFSFGVNNVVTLCRFVGADLQSQPPGLVFEYMDRGSLTAFLRDSRGSETSPQTVSPTQLLSFSLQILRGMFFLASNNIVHGSLRGYESLTSVFFPPIYSQ